MEGKEYENLSEKEQKQVDEIMSEGEMTDNETFEDDAIIAQKIKKGEIMSVQLIEKFKLLSERKLRKTEKEILVDFGKNITIEVLDDDKIKITIGKEEIIVTDQQAKKMISNGFGDRKFVSVVGVCKKETWEKKDKKGKIKIIIVTGLSIVILAIPIIGRSCGKIVEPIELPSYTEGTDAIPSSDPIYDPTVDPIETPEIEEYDANDIIKQFINIYWVPNIQQQNEWSALDDESVLGMPAHKSAEDINKEMQEHQKLIEDIMSFRKKYENKKLTEAQYKQCVKDAKELIGRINKMLSSAHDTLELAEVLNQKVIGSGVSHLGDLETESKARKSAIDSIEFLQQQFDDLEKGLSTGGRTI